MKTSFRTPIRGHRFAARPAGASDPIPGQPATLRREPRHPRDAWAVAVWLRSADGTPWRVGYLERPVAARLAPRLDAGERVEARVDGWWAEPLGRWRRPVLLLEVERGSRDALLGRNEPARAVRRRLPPRRSAPEDRLDGQEQPVGEQPLDHGTVEPAEGAEHAA